MEMTPKLKQAVKEFKSCKAESYEILYKESEKYIYTCIYKVMSGNNNALDITEEIMQETYLEIFLNISQLENEDKFLSWAGTIATRKCFAYIKKNKKYVLLNEDDDTFENLSDCDDIIPEEVMQNQEKRKLVRKIIDTQLTEVQKICIYEYYYNNRKQTEIAELYEMPLNTVKTNLARAKAKVEEGVLDLEKKDGIRLHSFAPFFVLLFTEDVMAAIVPTEVGAGVMSTIADTSTKAAEVGASVSGATTTSTVSTAGTTSSATTTTVATKIGMFGKIAAASTKAKILMAVATVSVVGTVGGGAMVASQNGLFGNAPIVNEAESGNDDTLTQIKYGVSNPDATYNETEYCYIVSDASFVEEKYNDGTEFDTTNWEPVNTMIKLNAPISIYNPFKDIMGYMKTDVTVVYVSADGEWSYLGFAGEVATDGLYSNGGTYVRTDELKAVMEEIDGNNSSAIGEGNINSGESEATVDEMYALTKEICDEAGFVYNESAFANVSLEDIKTIKTLKEYACETITIPIDKLDDKDNIKKDIVEYLKNNSPVINLRDGYEGINYILESVGIREPKYGEGSSRQYEVNVYLNFY